LIERTREVVMDAVPKEERLFTYAGCKAVRLAPYDARLFYEEDESDDTVVGNGG
jgi:hypothetical protein